MRQQSFIAGSTATVSVQTSHVRFSLQMRGDVVSALDLVFVGIGSRSAGLLQREIQALPSGQRATKNHFGDILNLPFDHEGREASSITRSRAVLLGLTDLRALSMGGTTLVIGVAGGKDKVDAIRTALKCRYVSVLITDAGTAAGLLA